MLQIIILSLLLSPSPAISFSVIAAPQDDATSAPEPKVVTTLQMDPENPRDFRGWWESDDALLKVDVDGRYQLWKGRNRFSPPSQVGRWHQNNHAVFVLESYAIPRTPPARVSMWLKGKQLMADISGKSAPFRKSKKAPLAPEDDLIGTWRGPGGELVFNGNLTYIWKASGTDNSKPVSIQSQAGMFSFQKHKLQMVPRAPQQKPVVLSCTQDKNGRIITLSTDFGPMQRVKKASAANGKADIQIKVIPEEPSSPPPSKP
ncbi:MAG: hypothetical protein MK085_12250 [Phycisphaerales bacterium]|nr:hypothetical protein [Phycisphaerales bacterium]